jgi:hypothetical protein
MLDDLRAAEPDADDLGGPAPPASPAQSPSATLVRTAADVTGATRAARGESCVRRALRSPLVRQKPSPGPLPCPRVRCPQKAPSGPAGGGAELHCHWPGVHQPYWATGAVLSKCVRNHRTLSRRE